MQDDIKTYVPGRPFLWAFDSMEEVRQGKVDPLFVAEYLKMSSKMSRTSTGTHVCVDEDTLARHPHQNKRPQHEADGHRSRHSNNAENPTSAGGQFDGHQPVQQWQSHQKDAGEMGRRIP